MQVGLKLLKSSHILAKMVEFLVEDLRGFGFATNPVKNEIAGNQVLEFIN